MRDSHRKRPLPTSVESFPVDESPDGIRGLAGNMMDWTASLHRKEGPEIVGGIPLETDRSEEEEISRIYRGGNWYFDQGHSRSAKRLHSLPTYRLASFGFRICRSMDGSG
jgi:eukaryotic-like serine/threonine-protein kinase